MRYIPDKDAADGLPPGEGARPSPAALLAGQRPGHARESRGRPALFDRLLSLETILDGFFLRGIRPGAPATDRQVSPGVHSPDAHRQRRGPHRGCRCARINRPGPMSRSTQSHRRRERNTRNPSRLAPGDRDRSGRDPAPLLGGGRGHRRSGFGVEEWSPSGRGQVLAPWPNRLDGGKYPVRGSGRPSGARRARAAERDPRAGAMAPMEDCIEVSRWS